MCGIHAGGVFIIRNCHKVEIARMRNRSRMGKYSVAVWSIVWCEKETKYQYGPRRASALKTLRWEKPDTNGYIFWDSPDVKGPEQANPQEVGLWLPGTGGRRNRDGE